MHTTDQERPGMSKVRVGCAMAAAVAAIASVSGCNSTVDKAGGTKPVHTLVLRLVNNVQANEIQPFVDEVTKLSKGALQVSQQEKVGSLTYEADGIRAVQTGEFDLGIVAVRAWHSAGVSSFDALLAPLAVDSMALQHKVLEGTMPEQMLAGLKPLGLVGIGLLPGPMRKPAGINRTLLAAADYKGAAVGTSRSAIGAESLRALGATPIDTPFNGADVASFDAIECQVACVGGNGYDDVVRTITENVDLWPRTVTVYMSVKGMQRLSGRQLSWLQSAARAARDATTQLQMQTDSEETVLMCRRGKVHFVTATSAQIAQLRSAFAPVYDSLSHDSQTRGFLDQIEATRRGGVTAYPQESLSCAGVTANSG